MSYVEKAARAVAGSVLADLRVIGDGLALLKLFRTLVNIVFGIVLLFQILIYCLNLALSKLLVC